MVKLAFLRRKSASLFSAADASSKVMPLTSISFTIVLFKIRPVSTLAQRAAYPVAARRRMPAAINRKGCFIELPLPPAFNKFQCLIHLLSMISKKISSSF